MKQVISIYVKLEKAPLHSAFAFCYNEFKLMPQTQIERAKLEQYRSLPIVLTNPVAAKRIERVYSEKDGFNDFKDDLNREEDDVREFHRFVMMPGDGYAIGN